MIIVIVLDLSTFIDQISLVLKKITMLTRPQRTRVKNLKLLFYFLGQFKNRVPD